MDAYAASRTRTGVPSTSTEERHTRRRAHGSMLFFCCTLYTVQNTEGPLPAPLHRALTRRARPALLRRCAAGISTQSGPFGSTAHAGDKPRRCRHRGAPVNAPQRQRQRVSKPQAYAEAGNGAVIDPAVLHEPDRLKLSAHQPQGHPGISHAATKPMYREHARGAYHGGAEARGHRSRAAVLSNGRGHNRLVLGTAVTQPLTYPCSRR